jgi:hypothetical protein
VRLYSFLAVIFVGLLLPVRLIAADTSTSGKSEPPFAIDLGTSSAFTHCYPFDLSECTRSLERWKEFAKSGFGWAYEKVADQYLYGWGTPADFAEAAQWLRQYVERAPPNLCGVLAKPPLSTDRVADLVSRYRRAADERCDDAYLLVAKFQASGVGVPRDLVEAYALATIAETVLYEFDWFQYPYDLDATALRISIAKELSESDIQAAVKRAHELRPDLDLLLRSTSEFELPRVVR